MKKKFFFIHNYKTLGTTILHQLPSFYKNKYPIHQVKLSAIDPNNKLNPKIKKKLAPNDEQISLWNHTNLDDLFELGLLDENFINSHKCLCLIREPIERFLSICNCESNDTYNFGLHPKELIKHFKNKTGKNFLQSYFYKLKNEWDIDLICMEDKNSISNWFKNFGVCLNLNIRDNVSLKKYSKLDLSEEDLVFLNNYFKEDYLVYKKLKKEKSINVKDLCTIY